MAWWRRLLGIGKAVPAGMSSGPAVVLSEDFLDALAKRDYRSISGTLLGMAKTLADERAPQAILSAARDRNWPEGELEKLEIVIDHYGGRNSEALAKSRKRLAERGFDADLYVTVAFALYQTNQFEEARSYLNDTMGHEDLLRARGDYWFARALICLSANDLAGAKDAADHGCQLIPDEMGMLENAAAIYLEYGDMERFDAIRARLRAFPVEPGYSYAIGSLALGDYEDGFRRLEARYDLNEAHRYMNKALFAKPRWRGEDLAGKSLLLSAEQGLGDTIQMSRYFPRLLELPARQVVVETQRETLSLLQHSFPGIDFRPRKYGELPDTQFDTWTGSMSLPFVFGSRRDTIPCREGYLTVPPENAEYWMDRVSRASSGRRPRIGISWSGQPTHRSDRRRSVPFALMAERMQATDADFFALQTNTPAYPPSNLWCFAEELLTLADTAALIEQMDLIITIDSCPVHLAGAIAKETWLLLPKGYEWRWGLEGEGNSWYDSVRVLRQERQGDWASLLDDVFHRRVPDWRRQVERWQ